jgi:hypothetical protein
MRVLMAICLLSVVVVAAGCDESSVPGGVAPDREGLKQAGTRCLKQAQAKQVSAQRLQKVMRDCLRHVNAKLPEQ